MYTLDGDLGQMSTMSRTLALAGFPVGQNGVYPSLPNEVQYKKALEYLYKHETDGWWNQSRDMIKNGICTEEQYKAKLEASCNRKRSAPRYNHH